ANNLYGWAMANYLPYKNFKWESANEFDEEKIMKLEDESDIGYFFEVDLDYPKELHDLHNDYPLAPENLLIKDDWLSPFSRGLKNELHIKQGKVSKLLPNLFNKTKYILHYRNLKLYLSLGMKLKCIHRVL